MTEYRNALVSCLSCGNTTETKVRLLYAGDLSPKAKCPKCSNQAFTNNLKGLWLFMQEASREIARLKLDMMDLQDAPEDR